MKWGVRRYQNSDGTRTSLGKRHEKRLRNAINSEEKDLVLRKGKRLDRMVGFKDFNPNKIKAPLFASYEKNDVNAYKLFLQDFSKTQRRYHVTLKTVDKIVAPNREHTKEIFDKFRDNEKFNSSLAELYGEKIGRKLLSTDIQKMSEDKYFNTVMWSLAKQGKSTSMLKREAKKRGYNAFRDYHDIDGKFTKSPIILLNAKSQVVKTGEKFVTEADRQKALKGLRLDKKNLPISLSAASFGLSIANTIIPNYKLSSLHNMKEKEDE